MADLLDRADIDTALESLPGWSYDGEALVKRVDVPADSRDALVESVAAVSDELDHHPDVSADDSGLRFRLWTHSDGGVTDEGRRARGADRPGPVRSRRGLRLGRLKNPATPSARQPRRAAARS